MVLIHELGNSADRIEFKYSNTNLNNVVKEHRSVFETSTGKTLSNAPRAPTVTTTLNSKYV